MVLNIYVSLYIFLFLFLFPPPFCLFRVSLFFLSFIKIHITILWQKLNTNWLINIIDPHNLPKYHEDDIDVIVVAQYHLCHCWRLLYVYAILVVVQMCFSFNLLQSIIWVQLPLFHISWSIVRFFNISNLNY
jgi:hypothetical protein